jgi:hypothetical protein
VITEKTTDLTRLAVLEALSPELRKSREDAVRTASDLVETMKRLAAMTETYEAALRSRGISKFQSAEPCAREIAALRQALSSSVSALAEFVSELAGLGETPFVKISGRIAHFVIALPFQLPSMSRRSIRRIERRFHEPLGT